MEALQNKKVTCPICDALMKYESNFWRCPTCKTETWPDEAKLAEIARMKKAEINEEEYKKKLRWSISMQKITPEPLPAGGGLPGSSGSKSGKKRKKKPTVKNIYLEI